MPEGLEFAGVFDDLFEEYAAEAELQRVKTAGLGSLNRLTYRLVLKSTGTEKALIDAIRCRNGNLNIVCGRIANKDAL